MSQTWGREPRNLIKGPLGVSALLHVGMFGLLFFAAKGDAPVKLPPIYKVKMVAAPPGPRAIGEVRPPSAAAETPSPSSEPAAPPKSRDVAPTPNRVPTTKSAVEATKKATPTTNPAASKTPVADKGAKGTAKPATAPRAGGGPNGGRGSDVANVNTGGVDFPYPAYLTNIVRQIALNFKPSNPNSPLAAELSFIIRRDGTVSDIKYVTKSGVYSFDLEARGAIEKAAKSFGPLPEGFKDDALPVVFSFDPKFLR